MNTQEKYQDVCRLTDIALNLEPVREFMEGGNLPLSQEHEIAMHLLNVLGAMRALYRRDQ